MFYSYRTFFLVSAFFAFGSIALFVGGHGAAVHTAASNPKKSVVSSEPGKQQIVDDDSTRASLSRSFGGHVRSGDGVVVAWCPSCTKLEAGLRKRGFVFARDIIPRGDFAKMFGRGIDNPNASLPVLRMRLRPEATTADLTSDSQAQAVCHVVGALIQSEGRSGGCVIQNETEDFKTRGLVMQWLEGRRDG